MKKFKINTAKSYDVCIGSDILSNVGEIVKEYFSPRKICIVTDSTVNKLYADIVMSSLQTSGYTVTKIIFPAGEHSKTLATYSNILEAVADDALSRSDLLLALGGGVVTDLTGFVAGTYMRGIEYLSIPTTLQSAIDSSVGGKTAVNLLSGKNLVGCFWQPSLVICDYKVFSSLDEIRLRDGIAEAVKIATISESELIPYIEQRNYMYLIERCVSIKKSLIEADELDTGLRQLLNFGHTIGHAIERLSFYNVSHGSAVAKGMIAEARASYALGLTKNDISEELTKILNSLGFDTSIEYSYEEIYRLTLMDKKINNGKITLIVPERFGKCTLTRICLTELENFIREACSR